MTTRSGARGDRTSSDTMTDAEWDFAVFIGGLRPADVRDERWVTPPRLQHDRMYDMQTEAHLATIRLDRNQRRRALTTTKETHA